MTHTLDRRRPTRLRAVVAAAVGAGALVCAPAQAQGADADGTLVVHLTQPDGKPLASKRQAASVWSQRSDGFWTRVSSCDSDPAGRCTISAPSGRYKVLAHAPEAGAWTFYRAGTSGTSDQRIASEVALGSGAHEDLAVRLEEGARVSGTVAGRASTTSTYTAWLHPTEIGRIVPPGAGDAVQVSATGQYTFPHVAAGSYRLSIQDSAGANPTEYVGGDGTASGGQVLTAHDGARIESTTTLKQWATVEGTVSVETGDVQDLEVAYSSGDGWRSAAGSVPDAQGRYSFKVRPGRYQLDFRGSGAATPSVRHEYWRQSTVTTTADDLYVASGEVRSGVDAHLTAAAPEVRPGSTTHAAPARTAIVDGEGLSVDVTTDSSGPDPTGRVQLVEGDERLTREAIGADGSATLVTGALTPGSHEIRAHYEGSDEVRSSYSLPFRVLVLARSSVSVSPSRLSAAGGELDVRVAANGVATPGEVRVSLGGRVVGTATLPSSGVGRVRLGALPVGARTLTVAYAGSAGAAPATVDHPVTVSPVSTRVTAQPTSRLVAGRPGSINVRVHADGLRATGAVTVADGTRLVGRAVLTADANGLVRVPIPARPAGTRSLRVVYAGSSTHASSSVAVRVPVARVSSTLSARASQLRAKRPGRVAVVVTTRGVAPTGTVSVKDGTRSLGRTVLTAAHRGRAVVPIKGMRRGRHTLTVTYAGNSQATARTTRITVVVR